MGTTKTLSNFESHCFNNSFIYKEEREKDFKENERFCYFFPKYDTSGKKELLLIQQWVIFYKLPLKTPRSVTQLRSCIN